jgi:transposase
MSACGQYETDLTDEQWEVLYPLLPAQQWRPGGPGRPPCDRRPRFHDVSRRQTTGSDYWMFIAELCDWVQRKMLGERGTERCDPRLPWGATL